MVVFLKKRVNNSMDTPPDDYKGDPAEFETPSTDYTSDEAITNLLREALREKLADTKKYPTQTQLRQALISSMLEFMSCFKLIGYDVDGKLISLTCTKNEIQKHALTHAFLDEFSKVVSR